MRFANPGEADRLNVVEGVTLNAEPELPAAPLLLTVIAPVAVPSPTTKVMVPEAELTTGCAIAPPPCCGSDTPGDDPKLIPVMVTEVPMGPDLGLKSEMRGAEAPPQPRLSTAFITV